MQPRVEIEKQPVDRNSSNFQLLSASSVHYKID